MGRLREKVAAAVPNGEKVACVVPSDVCLVGSVSNWAADALCVALHCVDPRAEVLSQVERFDRRGTEPFELFTSEFVQNSCKIQEFSLENSKIISENFNSF